MQGADWVSGRRYGLDWLRITAFGLLIFYHIGMYFVSWDWHVQTLSPQHWLEIPMLALNPWRLALLFMVSGIASRALLAKLRSPRAFSRERSKRLLIPLWFGVAVVVAPQAWVELRVQSDYAENFPAFWLRDYFEFGDSRGLILPTWNHLWFVAYLWVYTMVLALLALLPDRARGRLQRGFERLFAGWRLFALPVAWLFAARTFLHPVFGETHRLVDDPYAHSLYAFAFFFGVGLARSQALWAPLIRHWKPSLAAAVLGYTAYLAIYLAYFGDAEPPEDLRAAARAARSVMTWGALLGLLGVAQLFLHRDGPARRYLTQAIFPYYIVHQTIIVLASFWLQPLGLGAGTEFLVLAAVTVVGCALTFELVRRGGWLRLLFGLKHSRISRDMPPVDVQHR